MMDWLWAIWLTFSLAGFAFLETAALKDWLDIQPLTYWVRMAVLRCGWLVAIIAGAFLSWFAFHILIEPVYRASRRIREAMKEEQ